MEGDGHEETVRFKGSKGCVRASADAQQKEGPGLGGDCQEKLVTSGVGRWTSRMSW